MMFKKIILYLSAFLPMLLIMWIRESVYPLLDIWAGKLEWADLSPSPLLITELMLMIGIASALFLLMKSNRKVATKKIKIDVVKNRTAEYYLAYYSLFILSLIGFSLTEVRDIIVLILLLTVLGIVYIKNELYFINPTINIFRSFIYEVEYSSGKEKIGKLLISKDKLKINQIVDIEVSEFEFAFVRRKNEKRNQTAN